MNIIEQAARRLEELRRSGVEIPAPTPVKGLGAQPDAAPIRPRGSVSGRDGAASRPAPLPANDPSTPALELDLRRLASMGYVTPDNPRTQIANEFRVIKRPILSNVQNRSAAPVERANLIMVTSSLPGEGKTFVAINPAISIAMELDTTVLLVDADVSRPSVPGVPVKYFWAMSWSAWKKNVPPITPPATIMKLRNSLSHGDTCSPFLKISFLQ